MPVPAPGDASAPDQGLPRRVRLGKRPIGGDCTDGQNKRRGAARGSEAPAKRKTSAPTIVPESQPDAAAKRYACRYCAYRGSMSHHVTRHERVHFDDKPFPCRLCGFRTKDPSYLLVHMRLHTGERRFKCAHCDYSALLRHHLKEHERTHASGRPLPFACGACNFRAAQRAVLQRHELAMHGLRRVDGGARV